MLRTKSNWPFTTEIPTDIRDTPDGYMEQTPPKPAILVVYAEKIGIKPEIFGILTPNSGVMSQNMWLYYRNLQV